MILLCVVCDHRKSAAAAAVRIATSQSLGPRGVEGKDRIWRLVPETWQGPPYHIRTNNHKSQIIPVCRNVKCYCLRNCVSSAVVHSYSNTCDVCEPSGKKLLFFERTSKCNIPGTQYTHATTASSLLYKLIMSLQQYPHNVIHNTRIYRILRLRTNRCCLCTTLHLNEIAFTTFMQLMMISTLRGLRTKYILLT